MINMTYHQPQALVLPPATPPSSRNTVASATVSVIFSVFISVIAVGSSNFPSNAPVESILAGLAMMGFTFFNIVFGFLDLITENQKSNFKKIVERYSAVTGDLRYNPYIIQPRVALIGVLYGAALIIPILVHSAIAILNAMEGAY